MRIRLPAVALKHFEMAQQFAPKDKSIEELQVAAALAVAHEKTDLTGHSGISEAEPSESEVGAVLRKTCQITHVVEARNHLDESAGELGRKQDPSNSTWVKGLAMTYLKLKETPKLKEMLKLLAEMDPDDAPVRRKLTAISIEEKD